MLAINALILSVLENHGNELVAFFGELFFFPALFLDAFRLSILFERVQQ
jgi:hypothetical protein